jgi:SWI/SNF-related matrix-associated actin-dependent regulator of chromatin subfamily A member 5
VRVIALALPLALPLGVQLNAKELALKRKLLDEGFGDWTRKDFKSFTNALEQFGRKDKDSVYRQVSHETGKTEVDVERYFDAFNKNAATVLADFAKVFEGMCGGW